MANYKLKNPVGKWATGRIITDKDLKDNPQYGGVERLRDKLGAIEDTSEEPGDAEGDRSPGMTSGNPLGPRESVEERISKTKGEDPNAKGRGGKS